MSIDLEREFVRRRDVVADARAADELVLAANKTVSQIARGVAVRYRILYADGWVGHPWSWDWVLVQVSNGLRWPAAHGPPVSVVAVAVIGSAGFGWR